MITYTGETVDQRNTLSLLLRLEICRASFEINIMFSQKIGNQSASRPNDSTVELILKGYTLTTRTLAQLCSKQFCVIARTWKPPKCPSTEE